MDGYADGLTGESLNTTNASEGATASTDHAESKNDGAKSYTQDDLERILKERLGRLKDQYKDYDQAKADAAELAKIRDGQKTELEKATAVSEELKAKLAEAEAGKADAELRLLRRDIAADKGLTDPKLVKRVGGNSAEEIEADVAELLEVQGATRPAPKPNPQQGKPSTGRAGSIDSGRERFLARHGKK